MSNPSINKVSDTEAILKIVEKRYLLVEQFPEKKNNLNNNLHDLCKTLEITDADITVMKEEINNKSVDILNDEENAKTIVKNYSIYGSNINIVKPSLSGAVINFFKNITVVDFMVLNKKAVVFLLMLSVASIVLGYALYMKNIVSLSTPVEERIKNLIDFLNLQVMSFGLIMGFILPLLIKNILSYTPILLGFTALGYYILHVALDTANIGNNTVDIVVHLLALCLTVSYAVIINVLRKKYAFKSLLKK